MFWLFMSVVVICASSLLAGNVWMNRMHPLQKNVNEDFIKRLEQLERQVELKKLRG